VQAGVDLKPIASGATLLHHLCAVRPSVALSRILLQAGVPVNAQRKDGSTALMQALLNKQCPLELIECFLLYGKCFFYRLYLSLFLVLLVLLLPQIP
jgi:ankyrin repeat protein